MSTGAIVRRDTAAATVFRGELVDRVYVVLAGWLMTGVFLDAGAHVRHLPDSFWTPWHGVLYSGLLACGAFLVAARLVAARSGERLLDRGYDLSFLGVVIGAFGGVADAIWHTLFGIEFDLDAAVSPSHLVVGIGIFLVVSGPLRAATSARRLGVVGTLSLLYTLSIVTILVDYANPFAMQAGVGSKPAGELARLEQTQALFAFVLYAALLAGALLPALRLAAVPAWAPAAIVGANAVALALVNAPLTGDLVPLLVLVAVAGAALVGVAAAVLRPSSSRPAALRAFGFLAPALLYAAYAGAIVATHPTWWTPTFWAGLVAVGGIVGLLVSAIVPAGPTPR